VSLCVWCSDIISSNFDDLSSFGGWNGETSKIAKSSCEIQSATNWPVSWSIIDDLPGLIKESSSWNLNEEYKDPFHVK
jgi:hypothetical protein